MIYSKKYLHQSMRETPVEHYNCDLWTVRSEGCILKSLRFVWLHWRLNTQLVIMIVSLNVCIATIIPGDSKHYGLQRGQLLLALVIKIIIRHTPSILVKTAPSFLLCWGQVWPYEALHWGPGDILQSMKEDELTSGYHFNCDINQPPSELPC